MSAYRFPYIVVAHELGHNFGLPHTAAGIMGASAGRVTDFARDSQRTLCNAYPRKQPFLPFFFFFFFFSQSSPLFSLLISHIICLFFIHTTEQAGRCDRDYNGGGGPGGCDCPASWECGSVCGRPCPGLSCPNGQECINNQCSATCTPQCGPNDSYECGPNGCGGTCGECRGWCCLFSQTFFFFYPPYISFLIFIHNYYHTLFLQEPPTATVIVNVRDLAATLGIMKRKSTTRGEDGVSPLI